MKLKIVSILLATAAASFGQTIVFGLGSTNDVTATGGLVATAPVKISPLPGATTLTDNATDTRLQRNSGATGNLYTFSVTNNGTQAASLDTFTFVDILGGGGLQRNLFISADGTEVIRANVNGTSSTSNFEVAVGATQAFTLGYSSGALALDTRLDTLNLGFTSVPEPSSAALMGLAGVMLLARRRRSA